VAVARYNMVERQRRRILVPFLLPAFALFGTLVLYPVITTGYIALTEWNGVGPARYVGAANFIRAIHDPLLRSAISNTAVFVVVGGLVLFPLAFLLAYGTQRLKHGNTYRFLILVPIALSVTTAGLLWKFLLNPNFGLVSGTLRALGLDRLAQFEWLGETSTAMFVVIAATIWHGVGVWMLFVAAALEGVPPELREAAALDGASQPQIVRYVVLPLIWPVLRMLILLWVVQASQAFGFIVAITNGGPLGATEVIGTYLYKVGFGDYDFGYSSAIAVSLTIVVLGLALVWQRLSRSQGEEM